MGLPMYSSQVAGTRRSSTHGLTWICSKTSNLRMFRGKMWMAIVGVICSSGHPLTKSLSPNTTFPMGMENFTR